MGKIHSTPGDQRAEQLLARLVRKGDWFEVDCLLAQHHFSDQQRRWAIREAAKRATDNHFKLFIRTHCDRSDLVSVMPILSERHKLFSVKNSLYQFVVKSLYTWATTTQTTMHDALFWEMLRGCRKDESIKCILSPWNTTYYDHCPIYELSERHGWKYMLCHLLSTAILHAAIFVISSESEHHTDSLEQTENFPHVLFHEINSCVQRCRSCVNDKVNVMDVIRDSMAVFTEAANTYGHKPVLLFNFLTGLNLYHANRDGQNDDDILLAMLAILPLFKRLQVLALEIMLMEEKYSVVRYNSLPLSLSYVWEPLRREFFKAAVKCRDWWAVKRWADHTLQDDLRAWALEEAFHQKQWEVMLVLAEHGLTDSELMRVHYRLAKNADWDLLLHMFERGGDVMEVRHLLQTILTENRKPMKSEDIKFYRERCAKLLQLENKLTEQSRRCARNALKQCKWRIVFLKILLCPDEDYICLAIETAIEHEAWHVVTQLVRLGMDGAQRNAYFLEMVRRRQWGVCSALLEQGVRVDLGLVALPELMKMHQWMLVARVVNLSDDDDVRRQVLPYAMERREGHVVWLCISTMKNRLPVEERERLFQWAMRHEIWQAVKPFVEVEDDIGITHRDTALLAAIAHHQWDVVDHCLYYHADINMKDVDGETPLNRAAKKKDWEAVDELVVRDGDPNLLDREGYSVLQIAITVEKWDIVKLLIKYHADIHQFAKGNKERTPLGALIGARQIEIIELTFLWCPDQWKGVTRSGETALHAATLSDYESIMYYLIARKVDPLAVTMSGQSALMYAVTNEKCPQRMVAECIRLGFSTHQPHLTRFPDNLVDYLLNGVAQTPMFTSGYPSSPFLTSVLLDLPTVTQMLYESGSCSNTELFYLHTELPELLEMEPGERRKVGKAFSRVGLSKFKHFRKKADLLSSRFELLIRCVSLVEKVLPFVREIATTPRTLQSSCRLVISHCLNVHVKHRHEYVQRLPLKEELKNYVMFTDLTDPDFGKGLWSVC